MYIPILQAGKEVTDLYQIFNLINIYHFKIHYEIKRMYFNE